MPILNAQFWPTLSSSQLAAGVYNISRSKSDRAHAKSQICISVRQERHVFFQCIAVLSEITAQA